MNFGYCLITLVLGITYYDLLTMFGVAYFGMELILIVGIALLELRTARSKVSGT
ncbi:Hypothetical protein I595_2150 [Croceitalea dokdonensis DOKDO 023]|uniref:Uncharacterized protein n=1 Tax=Croceitalea dokdonensis DOKDO 023 TaxID=1300341 RepID=A0A0P7AYW0_9FLAO|nr:Hypothetical protein I595_2150 [Croceitalea dokdonensis DOKDO 023]